MQRAFGSSLGLSLGTPTPSPHSPQSHPWGKSPLFNLEKPNFTRVIWPGSSSGDREPSAGYIYTRSPHFQHTFPPEAVNDGVNALRLFGPHSLNPLFRWSEGGRPPFLPVRRRAGFGCSVRAAEAAVLSITAGWCWADRTRFAFLLLLFLFLAGGSTAYITM